MPLVILEVWCGPAPLGRSPPAATRCSGMVHRWWSAGSVCWVRCRAAGRGSRRGWWCRNPGVVGDALGQGQQPAQPAQTPRDRVFAQGWVSEAAEFLQRGMAVVQPQGTDRHQVLRGVLAEDVHRLLNPGGAGRGGGRGAFLVGGVEGANRLPVLRCCARRRRRSCQLSRLSGASIRVSSAPMASSSRTRTRCAPRTSRVFAVIPTAGPPRSGPAPSPGPDNALPRRGSDPAQ